jgi:RNA polymerase sigma-70 factor (ECF subfamily)
VEEPNLVGHLGGLLRYARSLTRDHAEAEDLVQETYLRAFQKIESVRNPNSIKPWMFTILRNTWISRKRHLKRACTEPITDLASIPDTDADGTNNALSRYERHLRHELLLRALHRLPLEAREILMLREFDDLSYQEIAGHIGCPVGTVMSRLARARLKLKNLLAALQ